MSSSRACHRCERRPGVKIVVRPQVSDVFAWHVIEEIQVLCHWCRSDADRENRIAERRRSGSYGIHFHNEFLVVP